MSDYRTRTKVNSADIVREKIAAGQLPEDLADRIQRASKQKEEPLYKKLWILLFTGRKRKK